MKKNKSDKRLTKRQLVTQIARNSDIPQIKAKSTLNSLLEILKTELKKGNRVSLVGFGVLSSGKRKARTGRNPMTGRMIQVSAKKIVRFKASKNFLDYLNKKEDDKNDKFSTDDTGPRRRRKS